MTTPTQTVGTTNRANPTPSTDNTTSYTRHWPGGEVATVSMFGSKLHALADQGTYFTACNATPNTALAGIAAADGLDDLEALVFLRNGSNATKRIYLDYISLSPTDVGTTGSDFSLAIKLDSGGTRYASGGTAITPKNANMASTTTSGIDRLQVGAVVPTAATANARLVWHQKMRTVIKVAGDKYLLTFGSGQPAPVAATAMAGTAQAAIHVGCPPIVLGPGDTFLLHEFSTAQNAAATWSFTMGWWEV